MQRKYNHLDRALIILGFNSDDVVCSTPLHGQGWGKCLHVAWRGSRFVTNPCVNSHTV